MARGLGWLFLGGALAVSAQPPRDGQRQQEALAVTQSILEGQKGPLVSRLKYLGEEQLGAALLLRQLSSDSAAVRERVADALAELCLPATLEGQLRLADDPEPLVRMPALRGLGCLHAPRSALLLRKHLNDPAEGARAAAAHSLGELHDPKQGSALMRGAQMEGDVEVRSALIEALGASGDVRQTPFLRKQLQNPSAFTRDSAVRALCLLQDRQGLEEARKRLSATEQTDRLAGIELLRGVPLKAVRPLLEPLLKDLDPTVAAHAAAALHHAGDPRMVAWLVHASNDAKPEQKPPFDEQLEQLEVTGAQRAAILGTAHSP